MELILRNGARQEEFDARGPRKITRARYVAGGVPYFFLDYSLPRALAFKLHLGLAGVVVLFFYLGVFVTTQLGEIAVPARCLVHVLIVGAIVRFRPPPKYRARAKAD